MSILLCATTTAACSLLTTFDGFTGSQATPDAAPDRDAGNGEAAVSDRGGVTLDAPDAERAPDGSIDAGCPTGKTLCSGKCVDTSSDDSNCAQCGNACIASHCASGQCQFDCAGTVSVLNRSIADGTYAIISSTSALPLDDPAGVGAGTGLDLYPYTGANQQWTVAHVTGGQYKILAQNGLAVTSQGLGNPIELAPYGAANTQLWGIVADGPDYNVVNTGTCLAMDDESAPIYSAGVDVTQYQATNLNQFWSFESAASLGLCGNNAQACCPGNACTAPSTACLSSATSMCRTPLPAQCACGVLYQGMELQTGQTLQSCDNRFSLSLANGSLTLTYAGTMLWSSGTAGSGATYATMQDDGDFVLYAGDAGAPQWASGTAALGCGAYLDVQNDGNLVLYDSSRNTQWTSGTCCH